MLRHTETLALCPIFEKLGTANIHELDARCRWRRYAAGCSIEDMDLSTSELCFVVNGIIRVTARWSHGKTIILRDLDRGSFVGNFKNSKTEIAGQLKSSAITNAVIARMPFQTFQSAIAHEPDLLLKFVTALTLENEKVLNRLAEFSFLRVRERVFAELIRMSRNSDKTAGTAVISPPPYHADIAARVSTHREAVSRAISELEKNGLLERRRGAMVIKDVAGLRSLLINAGCEGRHAP